MNSQRTSQTGDIVVVGATGTIVSARTVATAFNIAEE